MSKPELDRYGSLVAFIRNSIGAHTYRNYFATVDGQHRDLLEDGNLSCAFYVSTVLKTFDLIETPHLTVHSTLADMERSGWTKLSTTETTQIKPGMVIHWAAWTFPGGDSHEHVGFALDPQTAVSNSYKEKAIVQHHSTFENARPIAAIYTHQLIP